MITGPVGVTALFTFPRPLTHRTSTGRPSAQWRTYKRSRPDLDHLLRSIGDAITVAGVIKDDAQIVHWDALKVYGDEACARVVIRHMDEGQAE
jgi:Holliday junction resolvase RusA-like endonuclease